MHALANTHPLIHTYIHTYTHKQTHTHMLCVSVTLLGAVCPARFDDDEMV
jgi:hypothetical protein